MINENGVILADNILYKGYVMSDYNKHKQRTAVRNLREYIKEVTENPNIETEILEVGDGLAVSRINKLVAKSIILQSEITSSELYQLAIQDNSYLRLLSEEEFESIRAASSFKDGMLNVGVKRLDGKYSSTFVIALFLESNNDISNFIKVVNKAEALYNEGVSPDMRAYLLMKG